MAQDRKHGRDENAIAQYVVPGDVTPQLLRGAAQPRAHSQRGHTLYQVPGAHSKHGAQTLSGTFLCPVTSIYSYCQTSLSLMRTYQYCSVLTKQPTIQSQIGDVYSMC